MYVPSSRGDAKPSSAPTYSAPTSSSLPPSTKLPMPPMPQVVNSCRFPRTPLGFLSSIKANSPVPVCEFVALQTLWMLSGIWIVLATNFTAPASAYPLKTYRAASMAAGAGQIAVTLFTMFLLYKKTLTFTKYLFKVSMFGFVWSAAFFGALTISTESPYYEIKQTWYAHLAAAQLGGFALGSIVSLKPWKKDREWKSKAGFSAFTSFVLAIFLIILCVPPVRDGGKSALFLLVSNSVICGCVFVIMLMKDYYLRFIQWLSFILFLLSLATTGISTLDVNGGVFYDFSNGYLFHIVQSFFLLSLTVRTNLLDYDQLHA